MPGSRPADRPLRIREPRPPAGLQAEVTLLTDVLDDVLAESDGSALLEAMRWLRSASVQHRGADAQTIEALLEEVDALDGALSDRLAQAFTLHCQLVNICEDRQRSKTARMKGRDGQVDEDGIVAGVREVASATGKEGLAELIGRTRIHPVFTAHPTEARRRAIVEGLSRVAAQLKRLDLIEVDDALAADVRAKLTEEIGALWATAPFRHVPPSPIDEVRRVLAVFGETVYEVVADVYREVDRALDAGLVGARPPATPAFLRYGSWVGGDRDGNPFVTAEVTRATGQLHADEVLTRLERSTRTVSRLLTVSTTLGAEPSAALSSRLEECRAAFPERAAALARTSPDQPHRHLLLYAADRLAATRTGGAHRYDDPAAFLADLALIQESLADAGLERLAYGQLQELRWRAETFGFHLASLEVRQHSAVHARVLEELAPGLAGDAEALAAALTDDTLTAVRPSSDEAREVLETFRAMADLQARYGPEACFRHIVSFTTCAADLLAVPALARAALGADRTLHLRVVPLFETRADLDRAAEVLDDLLAVPGGRAIVCGQDDTLEVMIGYSDSAKDAGLLAAQIALHRLQSRLARWSRENGVSLTLFHGRGGSMGRGGGPLNRAIRSQGGGSVDGRLKVTEQGEVIYARYRSVNTARRHLERTVNAVLAASTPSAEERAWAAEQATADLAETMAQASEAAYRSLVDADGFAAFFAAVTPYEEVGTLHIGSRPTHRTSAQDLASLRAIPWVFAWSQSRVNLTGWYGLGSGLAAVGAVPGGLERLRQARRSWPFFASLLETAEMSLAKADKALGRFALMRGGNPELAATILEEWERTEEWVRKVTGQDTFLERQPALRAAIGLRRADVDALSMLQLVALARLRTGRGDRDVDTAIVRNTVAGLSAGLQNTG